MNSKNVIKSLEETVKGTQFSDERFYEIKNKIESLQEEARKIESSFYEHQRQIYNKNEEKFRKYVFKAFPKLKENLLKIVYNKGGMLENIDGESIWDKCSDFLLQGLTDKIKTRSFKSREISYKDCLAKDNLAIYFSVERKDYEIPKYSCTFMNLYNTAVVYAHFVFIDKDDDGKEQLEFLKSFHVKIASIPCVDETCIFDK